MSVETGPQLLEEAFGLEAPETETGDRSCLLPPWLSSVMTKGLSFLLHPSFPGTLSGLCRFKKNPKTSKARELKDPGTWPLQQR